MWRRILIALMCTSVLLGCERRPLHDPSENAELRIRILTDGISNVTKDIYNDKIPHPEISTDIMRVMFYDKTGEHMLSEGFISRKEVDEDGNEIISGEIMLSPGNFRVLAYNFDMPTTQVKNHTKWDEAKAYTSPVSSNIKASLSARSSSTDNIYYQPEHVLVAREKELSIRPHFGTHIVELDARTIVDTYYIQIRVKNIDFAASATAILTGLSSSNNFGDNVRNTDGSGIYIKLQKSTDDRIEENNKDVLCAVFNTFGRIDDIPSNLKIVLSATSPYGEIVEKEIDMAPVFLTEDAQQRHWLLIDEVWELPDPFVNEEEGSGGWTPVVDDWEDVIETFPIYD